jgi:peptidoglycan DL-endopeptidase CwlO
MIRFRHSAVAVVAAVGAILSAGVVPHAAADPLSTAKEQAAALTKTVNALQTRAEVATERYDAIQSRLNIAIANQGQADQRLAAVQATAAVAQQTVNNRALALYESGGDLSGVASLLTGASPTAAIDGYRMASAVIANETRSATAAATTVQTAQLLDQKDSVIAHQIITLQTAKQGAQSKIEALLADQKRALADANGTVRRIMKADEAAQAAAQQAAFASSVASAGGGPINFSGPITAPNNIAAMAIAAAQSRIGVPYVWGATGPNAFDCSGLTQWSYAHAGVALPRTAAQQWNAGPHPSLSQLEPGDLLFWALNTADPATIHHVAMYIGNGLMIAAPHTGENVQVQAVYENGLIGAMRPWGPVTAS